MEIPITPTPRVNRFRESVDDSDDKPLPPTPTIPSSVYRLFTEDVPKTPRFVTKHDLRSSKGLHQQTEVRSSTSKVSDPMPTRPQMNRGAKSHGAVNPVVGRKQAEESRYGEWKAPKYQEPETDLRPKTAAPAKASNEREGDNTAQKQSAEVFAEEYISLLDSRSSVLPGSSFEPQNAESSHQPTPMSSRITDVVDITPVPEPMKLITEEESQQSSQFSSSSSEPVKLQEGIRRSLRSYAQKAMHVRNKSQDISEKEQQEPNTQSRAADGERQRKPTLSISTARRASIQKEIIDMYNTLTNLLSPNPKTKLKMEYASAKKKAIPEEHRNPAIPITPYQRFGTKAWETPNSPVKRSKSARTSTSSRLSKDKGFLSSKEKKKKGNMVPGRNPGSKNERSVGQKLAKAVGIDMEKDKKTKSEKWRAETKKKIVVLGPDGRRI